ncbi:hypothetical protein HaLaN_17794, partial [Haematococcus lacustris]
ECRITAVLLPGVGFLSFLNSWEHLTRRGTAVARRLEREWKFPRCAFPLIPPLPHWKYPLILCLRRTSSKSNMYTSHFASRLMTPGPPHLHGPSAWPRHGRLFVRTPGKVVTYSRDACLLPRTYARSFCSLRMSASGLTAVKATIVEVTSEIKGLEERIERLEEKIERLEQSYPANERPTELAVELGQLRTMENTLQEELVELLRQRNILLTREPACNLLNWGYKSVAIDSTTRIGHKRLYHGNYVEADLEGRAYPLTSEAQLNARSSQPGHVWHSQLRLDPAIFFAGQTSLSSKMALMCAGALARHVIKFCPSTTSCKALS